MTLLSHWQNTALPQNRKEREKTPAFFAKWGCYQKFSIVSKSRWFYGQIASCRRRRLCFIFFNRYTPVQVQLLVPFEGRKEKKKKAENDYMVILCSTAGRILTREQQEYIDLHPCHFLLIGGCSNGKNKLSGGRIISPKFVIAVN